MIQSLAVGRLGKPAETRQAGGGTVTSFSIAVDIGYGDKKATEWVECAIWGTRGEKLAQYLTKGANVVVSGSATIRRWESNGKHGASLVINVQDVKLMGGGEKREAQREVRQYAPRPVGPEDDDIPF